MTRIGLAAVAVIGKQKMLAAPTRGRTGAALGLSLVGLSAAVQVLRVV